MADVKSSGLSCCWSSTVIVGLKAGAPSSQLQVPMTIDSAMHRLASPASCDRRAWMLSAGRTRLRPAGRVSRLPSPCGKVHRTGLTGRRTRGLGPVLRCSRLRFGSRDVGDHLVRGMSDVRWFAAGDLVELRSAPLARPVGACIHRATCRRPCRPAHTRARRRTLQRPSRPT
jgi:hypothetical protein